MEWFKKDEGMSPDEAKERALGILNLWLYCRKVELVGLRHSWRKKYGMVRRIVARNARSPLLRGLLRVIELSLLTSTRWTRHRIEKIGIRISEITIAILELKANRPDSAMELLRENFPAEPDSSLVDGPSGIGMSGMSVFYIRLLNGLSRVRRVGKGKE